MTDRRVAGRDFRLWLQNPGAARQRLSAAEHDAALQGFERFSRRPVFDLGPIDAAMLMAWIEKFLVPTPLIA